MTADQSNDRRLHTILLSALSLRIDEFTAQATLIHRILSPWLARQASHQLLLNPLQSIASDDIQRSEDVEVRLAVLATFQKLAGLKSGVPIDVASLHDFIVVFGAASPSNATTKEDTSQQAFARSIVSDLLKRKPSLLRGIETQIVPSYIALLDSIKSTQTPSASSTITSLALNLDHVKLVVRSLSAILQIPQIVDILSNGKSAEQLWSRLQTTYDILLPSLLQAEAKRSTATTESARSQALLQSFVITRKECVDLLHTILPTLSTELLLVLLENEAAAPEIASLEQFDRIAISANTSLVNLSLLSDVEFYYTISEGNLKGGEEEKAYIQSSLKSLLPEGHIEDGYTAFTDSTSSKSTLNPNSRKTAKGNGRATTPAPTAGTNSSYIQQVLAILPDTAPEIVERILSSPRILSLPEDERVGRAIEAILEGDTGAEMLPGSGLDESTAAEESHDASRRQPAEESGQKKSAFAAMRRNVFDDQMDIGRSRVGKQAIEADTFLSDDLKAAILAAAKKQEEEALLSDDEEDVFVKQRESAFIDSDEEERNAENVRVKDDIDSESEAEEEYARQHPSNPSLVSGTASMTTAGSSSTPSASSMYPPVIQQQLLQAYTNDPSVFQRSAKKTSPRNDLKSKTGLSDEQIEGWAIMLSRDPRKDKILARVTEFRGNRQIAKDRGSATQSENESTPIGRGDGTGNRGRGRAGEGARGRGSKGNRGHQSDTRRRGRDKKVAKTGI